MGSVAKMMISIDGARMRPRLAMSSGIVWLFCLLIFYAVAVDAPITVDNMRQQRSAQYQKTEAFQRDVAGPPWHKALKDILLLCSVGPVLLRRVMQREHTYVDRKYSRAFFFVISAIALAFGVAIVQQGLVVAFWGLRSYWSLSAFLIGTVLATPSIRLVTDVVGGLVVVEAVVAALQWMLEVPSLDWAWGYRATGTFYDPNTLALFAVACLALLSIGKWSRSRTLYFACAVVVIILSGSRSGLIALLAWSAVYIYSGATSVATRGLVFTAALPAAIGAIWVIDSFAGRGSLAESLSFDSGTRLGIFLESLAGAPLTEWAFGRGLGIGSNVLHALGLSLSSIPRQAGSGLPLISDSMYTAAMMQGGVLLSTALVLFVTVPLFLQRRPPENRLTSRVVPCLVLLSGFGNVVPEVSPFNYIMFALYGWLARVEVHAQLKAENQGYL